MSLTYISKNINYSGVSAMFGWWENKLTDVLLMQ